MEEKKRRATIGISVKAGASIFDYARNKFHTLAKDIFIPKIDIMDHIGHFRFNFKLEIDKEPQRYAYEYKPNRGKYEQVFKEEA